MRVRDDPLATPLIEPLTRREREILGLLAQGYSGPEIAEQLTLAISSVKWHIQQVYGKLGVNSKRQALTRAQELSLLGPTLPAASPKPPPAPKHNLPLQVTHFFGREAEIAHIKERLNEYRLVMLTGAGGVGKTRLALRAAEAVLGDFLDGVWFIELAPLSDSALVPQQVTASLGLRDEPGRPMLDTLTNFLRDRQLLLILDNCEHLLTACAQLAAGVLRTCPDVKLLATSREALGVDGEALVLVPSLSFPDPHHLPALDTLSDYTALSLFVDRARAVLPNYALTPHNAPHLARICQRLDGIPLALEMAAARIRLLNAETLATRLDDAFNLLTSGNRMALPKHQTLRAMLDWSYNLLGEPERLLLQRLSVFAGGCTLEAAEAACAGEGLGGGEVLERLGALVSKSLVVAERQPGEEARYRLLEVVRQYAREKLAEMGESAGWHTRHRDCFLSFAEDNFPKLSSTERPVFIRKVRAEHDNLRLALEWSFSEAGDVEAGPRLFTAVCGNWPFAWQERFDWCDKALAWCESHTGIAVPLYISLLTQASNVKAVNDLPAALELAHQAVELARRLGAPGQATLMDTLLLLTHLYVEGFIEVESAQAPLAEAEAFLHALGPDKLPPHEYQKRLPGIVLLKARMARLQEQWQAAKMYGQEHIRLCEENHWLAHFLSHQTVGQACLELEEYGLARLHFLEALRLANESEDLWQMAVIRRTLGHAAWRQGNSEQAYEYVLDALQLSEKLPDHNLIAMCLEVQVGILVKQGRLSVAVKLSGASHTLYHKQGRKPKEELSLDVLLPGWRDGPESAALTQAFEAGQAMSVEEAVAYALEVATDDDVTLRRM